MTQFYRFIRYRLWQRIIFIWNGKRKKIDIRHSVIMELETYFWFLGLSAIRAVSENFLWEIWQAFRSQNHKNDNPFCICSMPVMQMQVGLTIMVMQWESHLHSDSEPVLRSNSNKINDFSNLFSILSSSYLWWLPYSSNKSGIPRKHSLLDRIANGWWMTTIIVIVLHTQFLE